MNKRVFNNPDVRKLLNDPRWFIPRLTIIDPDGKMGPIRRLRPEQDEFVDAFLRGLPIFVLKSRQIGITTITIACFVWWLLMSEDPEALVQVTHEGDAIASLNSKARIMVEGLPASLRPTWVRDTANWLEFGHNRASLRQRMAGGRSQGRAFSFQHDHYTEMAFWPTGSSAVVGKGVDRQTWASLRATRREGPRARTVVESTANGPRGIYYQLYKTARESDGVDWTFLFWPWFYTQQYTRRVPRNWERNDEEQELMALYGDKGLTDAHLVWRRKKLADGDDVEEFRKNYPSNPDEPFLFSESMAFDSAALNRLAARTRKDFFPATRELVIHERPIPNRRYSCSLDPCRGVGKDWAVAYVTRDDGKLVARWHSKKARPAQQAIAVAELSATYKCPIIVEYNGPGKFVFHELVRLGARVWLDERGKPWWTQRGSLGTKDRLIDFAATLIAEDHFLGPGPEDPWLADPLLVQELGAMRLLPNGNLSAPEGEHDDHAMSWMMSLWPLRGILRSRPSRLWVPRSQFYDVPDVQQGFEP